MSVITRATTVASALALAAVMTACGAETTDGKAEPVAPTSASAPSTGSSSDPDFPTTDPSDPSSGPATAAPTAPNTVPTTTPTTAPTSGDYYTVLLPTGWRLVKSGTNSKEYAGPSASSGGSGIVSISRNTTPLSPSSLDIVVSAAETTFRGNSDTVSVGKATTTTVDGDPARRLPVVLKSSGVPVAVTVTFVIHGGFGVTITQAVPAKAAATLGPGAQKLVDSIQWT